MFRRGLFVLSVLMIATSTTAPELRPVASVSTDRLVAHARSLIAHESGEPVPYLLEALRARSVRGDLKGVDEVLRLLAEHARDAGNAYEWGERIVELDLRRGVSDDVLARDLVDLARQYRYAVRRPDARETLDRAEPIARRLGDLGLLARIQAQRANLTGDEGRFMDAGVLLEAARNLFERHGVPSRDYAEVLAELGQLQAESGQLLEAWWSFARAEQIASQCLAAAEQYWQCKKANDSALMASAGRARILAAFGRFEEAIREGQNARRIALRSNLGDRRYMILAEMAEWAPKAGRPDLAERWYELALRVNDPYARDRVRLAYAAYLIETGRASEGLLLLGELPLDLPPKQRVERLLLMGRASLARKDNHGAIALFRKAVVTAQERVPLPVLLWQAHSGLGQALLRVGKDVQGTNELMAAVQVVRDWAGGVLDPALAYEDGPKSPWYGYSLLVATHVRQGHAQLALALSEEMKALAALADRSDAGLGLAGGGQMEKRVSDIRTAIASARRALHENGLRDPSARARATAELQLLDNELLRLAGQQERTGDVRPDWITNAAREVARQRECAIVSYCLGENESIAFIITAAGLKAKRLTVPKDQLRALAGLIRNYRLSPEHAWKSDPTPRLFGALYDTLIAPIEPELHGTKRLVIVPDGVLWSLPFEMLWQRQGSQTHYLIQRYVVSYANSVHAAVEWTARSSKLRRGALRDVRVVANGVANDESRYELSPRESSIAIHDAEIVRQALGGRVVVAEGTAATKDAMMRALSQANVLHVAAHGTYADDYPPASYISLARGEGDSGILRGWEIASAKCSARLVFLAACDTGRTSSVRGRGLLGLTGAVMAAGAHACIGSRWADRDAATESYLAYFYRYYAKSLYASDAAQKAVCHLIADGAPPYDWAAFVVLGW
ncbi:MAG: CHAT domain-containing protein [Fimbriimonadia bacterium]